MWAKPRELPLGGQLIVATLTDRPHDDDCIMHHDYCCPRYAWITNAGDNVDVWDLTGPEPQLTIERAARAARQRGGRFEAVMEHMKESLHVD